MLKKLEQEWLQGHNNSEESLQILLGALQNGFEVIDFRGKLILIFEKDVDQLFAKPEGPKGKTAYERRQSGEAWKTIEKDIKHSIMNAKMYALGNRLPWPIQIPR